MDSRYDEIEVWWPADGPALPTNADELLKIRNAESSALLESNLPIPVQNLAPDAIVDSAAFLTQEQNKDREQWDGLKDALDPVRQLITGDDTLIPRDVYQQQRSNQHRVLARISSVQTDSPWAFFGVRGTGNGAPRWVLLEAKTAPTIGLEPILARLRSLLSADPPIVAFDEECERLTGAVLTVGSFVPPGSHTLGP